MLAYATHADVEKYFIDFTFNATSQIKDSDVDAICVTEQAEVDGILEASTEYTVPITGTSALVIMKKLIELRAAAAAWRRMYVTTQSDQSTMADEWRKEADDLLNDIVAGSITLADAVVAASVDVSRAPRVASRTEIFTRDALDDFVDSHGTS